MVTIQINSNDINAIEQLLYLAKKQFNLQVTILDELNTPKENQTKWGEFAQKMDGLFTPEIVEHIKLSREEARENFISKIGD
jgi:hypothetical protein